MSSDWFSDVLTFARKFRLHVEDVPRMPPRSVIDLKLRHITEESGELREAFANGDLAGVADACADLIYVAVSAAQAAGIDLRPVWDAVHTANMAKTVGSNRQEGKILKPYGWRPPAIGRILRQQGPLAKLPGRPAAAPREANPRCWCGRRLDRDYETGTFFPCELCIGAAARQKEAAGVT